MPAHCIHKLQPLDSCVFKSLKAVADWIRVHPGKQMPRACFPTLFSKVWYASQHHDGIIAVNGFISTGIWPYNRNKMPKEAFELSNKLRKAMEKAPAATSTPKTASIASQPSSGPNTSSASSCRGETVPLLTNNCEYFFCY